MSIDLFVYKCECLTDTVNLNGFLYIITAAHRDISILDI